jgi:hypothetical protein
VSLQQLLEHLQFTPPAQHRQVGSKRPFAAALSSVDDSTLGWVRFQTYLSVHVTLLVHWPPSLVQCLQLLPQAICHLHGKRPGTSGGSAQRFRSLTDPMLIVAESS